MPTSNQLESDRDSANACEVVIVGAGVAGQSAGIFTARAGLETTIVHGGDPILRRNAHLENYPGFPAGVNARLLLDLMRDQAERAGCEFVEGRVTEVTADTDQFFLTTDDWTEMMAERVITASWSDASYLEGLDVDLDQRGSKRYVVCDPDGRTDVPGFYAAGRIAGIPHQTVVAAGNGARVGLAVIEDSEVPFYHDWVVPTGYFSGRDREVPPGCEEIDDEEFRKREATSRSVMRKAFAEPHPDEPAQHPSVGEKDD